MEFSTASIEKAWKKSGGQRGAWNPWDRSGLNGLGPDTAENCQILCYDCYMKARYRSALQSRV
jgi:hypothetical protein